MSDKNYQMDEFNAPTNATVERLQSRNRTLLALTVVSLVVAIVSFCVAVFAATGGMKHEDDISTLKTTLEPLNGPEVVLRVGIASGVPGFPSASSLFAGAGFWTEKKPLPTATSDFQAVAAGDKIYLIGGQNSTGGVLDTLVEYDAAIEKYTALTPMPAPRMRFGAAIHDGKIYVVNGLAADGAPPLKTTFIYDIASKVWSTGPETSIGRSDTCAAAAGGKIYIIAGYTDNYETLKSVEVMDTAASPRKWSPAADLPDKRGDVTCASSGSKVYAIGGYYDPSMFWSASAFHKSMFELDGATAATAAAWKNMTDMPSARGDKAAVTLSDGSIIVIGGEGHARGEVTQIAQHPVEQFFPQHNTWIVKASIPTARFRFAAAAVDDFVHAFGGHVLCETGWNGDWTNPDCATKALDSHEMLMDAAHPDIWIHTAKE